MNAEDGSEKSFFEGFAAKTCGRIHRAVSRYQAGLRTYHAGKITSVGYGIARTGHLPGAAYEELISLPGGRTAVAFNIDTNETGLVLLDLSSAVRSGMQVRRTGRVLDVPVGDALTGRIVDALGRPLDRRKAIRAERRLPVESAAPAIMDRAPVTVPLQTGLKVVDALIPIGRGQRELILGDRQTGKTAIALDTIINQHGKDMLCIYCAVGKQSAAVAKLVQDLKKYNALEYSTLVVATENDPPGLQFVAPYAAMTMAEHFMRSGRDALVVFDDLTRHARAYRELSLLLGRPPGREAFPGDIFYIHSRLLERSTHLREDLGGGSITALPVVETEAQNVSAYIPTNLISITDGQIYLSPDLFQKGVLPAVDIGTSVSRVGRKTQLRAYRETAGDLRLSYSQFEELESFARFGTRLEESTKRTLARGRRVREMLKQPQYEPMPASEQVALLTAISGGVFDDVEPERIADAGKKLGERFRNDLGDVSRRIDEGEEMSDDMRSTILDVARRIAEDEMGRNSDADD